MISKTKPDALTGRGNPSVSGSKLHSHNILKQPNNQSFNRWFEVVLIAWIISCNLMPGALLVLMWGVKI